MFDRQFRSGLRRAGFPVFFILSVTIAGMLAFHLFSLVSAVGTTPDQANIGNDTPDNKHNILTAYRNVPLGFEPNQGQASADVKFLSHAAGYDLFLSVNDLQIALNGVSADTDGRKPTVARMKLRGANPEPRVRGEGELPGKSNYFLGRDPSKWRTNIPAYSKVRYDDVYPGIDLVFYGNQRQLEYDFVVSPGSSVASVQLEFSGINDLSLDETGDLALNANGKSLTLKAPITYQEIENRRELVSGRYVLRDHNLIGFEVGDYDRSRPLVIDPVLSYSTYLGGSGFSLAYDVAVDGVGNAYVTGFTGETNFPTTAGAFDPTNELGGRVSFISKLNPQGTALVYSTYIGPGMNDGFAIAVDEAGSAYITGTVGFPNFPITPNAAQSTMQGGFDAFVTKLSPDGSTLVYSTFVGGNFDDEGDGIAIDAKGNAVITGTTDCYSTTCTFPIVNAFQPTRPGNTAQDAFVTKLNSDGSAFVFSTYLGGQQDEYAQDVALDNDGNAYVVGHTYSPDFPTTAGAYDRSAAGLDGYVTKFSPEGQPIYSTFIGGNGHDELMAVDVDAAGSAYVTGLTISYDFPTTAGAYKRAMMTGFDAFVTKFNSQGSGLAYSTFLGSDDGSDRAWGIAVDSSGNAYVAGDTDSPNFPVLNAVQPIYRGGLRDGFVTELNAAGSALVYSTYLGGGLFDQAYSIDVDANGAAYIVGDTSSYDFPVTAGAFQPANGGGVEHHDDAFVAKISGMDTPPTFPAAPSDMSAVTASSSQINLAWTDNSDNENGFKIERCSGAGCSNFAQIAQVGLNANAYADSAVSANTIYRYRVSAFNGSGTSTYSNIAETTTPPQTTQTDSVAIQRAYYNSSKRLLQVEATSTVSTAELNVYITSSGAYVGTLGENGRGRYRGSFSLLSNPQNITVRSSLGGTTSKTISLR